MLETNEKSHHIAGIIPVAGLPLSFNMPWHDCLMPINEDYHLIERAIHTAAMAGCNTIWVVLHRESQPIIKKKVGEWVYDPKTVWIPPRTYWNKKDIPVYYIAINPRDRNKKDSHAWSSIYGAKVASRVSRKLSKWVVPQKFFVVSPYGVINEKDVEGIRDILRDDKNILFRHNDKTFLDNQHIPFTFDQKQYDICSKNFKEIYSGKDMHLDYSDIFKPILLQDYNIVEASWHYRITNWDEYKQFISSKHNLECTRPKHLVTHKWWGFVKN